MSKYMMTAACGKRFIKWLGDRAAVDWRLPVLGDIVQFLRDEGFHYGTVGCIPDLAREVQQDRHALMVLIDAMGRALREDRDFIAKTKDFFDAAVSRFGVSDYDVYTYEDKTGERNGTLGDYLSAAREETTNAKT